MKDLTTLCSRGGIGRRKGLKILGQNGQYHAIPQFSLKAPKQLTALGSIINGLDRHNFVTATTRQKDG